METAFLELKQIEGNHSSANKKKQALKTKENATAYVAFRKKKNFFFFFEADFIQLVVLNLSHLNYIKLCLFLTSNER